MRKALTLTGVVLFAYVVAYFSLVVTNVHRFEYQPPSVAFIPHWMPTYRFGGRFAETLFWPVQRADVWLRPEHWGPTEQEVREMLGLSTPTP